MAAVVPLNVETHSHNRTLRAVSFCVGIAAGVVTIIYFCHQIAWTKMQMEKMREQKKAA